ncbi:MAG: tape measure protein [Bilophila wadsworthia]|uniref:tape measure protein n=1 Tax=Bilophila wadsworthia TaxID=35833 RepID=UPI002431D240|nr:tape measure protein [Bilophila wadsworthia]MCI6540719.1 tape measure protein [Bilophila wadsworthia]
MTGGTATVGIEVRADGTQEAARDLAAVDASLKKIQTDLGGTAQPAGVAAQGLEQLGAAGKSAGAGLGAVGASAKKAAEGLGSVSKFASSAKFDKVVSDLGVMGVKLNTSSLHAQKLAKAMQQVERERAFQQLAADANLSTLQLAKFRAELGDTRGALATLSNGLGLSKAAMLAFAAAVAFGGQACLEAALQADRLSKAYTTITGSSSAAQQQLSYLYDVSNRLGLQFQSTAESAKTFFAAGKGSSLEKDMNGIFEAVASAGAALALSQDDMQGAFLALGQMISKGKVQAEELRGQLGERLPGAFQLAAKAMNMTTAELDKFMADGKLTAEELLPKLAKVMKEDFGAAAEAASQGLQGAINRLSTEWTLFKSSLVDSDAAVAGINAVRGAVGGLQAAFDTLAKYKDIFKALTVGAGLAGIVALAPKAADAVLGLAASFKVLLPLLANPWTLALAAIGAAAAGVYYYAEQADVATQAQRALNSAQELSVRINKELADSTEDSADSLGARAEAARNQLEALQNARQSVLDSMSSENESAFAGWNFASLSANKFVDAIDRLKAEASKTGDFKGFEDALRNIELEARAAGKDTGEFKDALSDARATAALGIKLDISIQGMENLFNVQSWLRKFVGAYGISLSEVSPHGQKTDWKEQRDNATQAAIQKYEAAFTKTDSGRLETLRAQKKEYQDQLNQLGSLLLTDEQRNRQGQILNGLLNDTESKIKGILDKGKKKDNGLEQAQSNLDAYNAELGKTEASIASLRAQLATKPGEVFTREQAKIAAEYETTLKQIDKQAADYARKKGVSTEQANQLKNQRLIEAVLKRDLDLRQAQEKEEKRLADLAKDKYDFYKELEELTGQYGLSLKYQSEAIAAQVKELERLEIPQKYINQWRELKELQASHEWADGARRAFLQYRADATDAAKGAEEAFSSLYSGMDSGWKSAWEQMIETGKVSLSSFRSVFASFLADLMHMAITRPITVQIAGVVSGMLGTGGVAYAAGGNSGSGGIGLGNLPFSSLLPDSWTSGGSSFLSYELPGTAPGISGLYGPTMGGGNLASGLSLGSALMYGGLGSLGYSLLGGALGLPQNKYSGITSGLGAGLGAWGASAALSGTALGATLGSAVPVVGTVIGAALGGLASSLFGGGKKTHPSVYTNVVDASLFGSDWEALMTQGAWTDRASVSDAAGIFKGLGEVANTTASSIMGFAQALPEEYQAQVLARLNAETVSFGRGSTAGRKGVTDYGPSTWNFQFHDEEQLQEVINTAGEDIQRVMLNALQRAMAGTDLSSMLAVDLSSTEGLDKAIQAINAINTVTEATANIKEPLSEMEQQAKAARAQLDEWTESMRSLGVNADYAGKLMEDYRHAYIDNVIESLDESLHPLSAYAQAVKAANEAVDQRKKALEIIGATEGQLAQVEAMRAEVVKQATEEMLRSFDQSVAQRWAAVNGNSDEVGRAISQANELRETIQQFGEGSAQVAELLKLHAAETAKAAQDAAKSEYDSLKAQMDALEQQRVQLQQQAIQEQINAINEQLSAAKTLKSTWEGLDKSLGQSRYNLFAGSANLDAENRLGTVQAEFRRLSGLALGGDSDAAGQLAGVGNSLLDLVKQTAGTEEEYLDAFWAVNAQLKAAQEAAGAQVSAADKQLEALQGQLDVQNAALAELQGQSATLEEIEKQIAELRPLLDAAGDKAGVKAFARGGLAMPGWAVVGEEGPELVNFSQPGRVYTAADTAALFRSATPRGTSGESGGSREEVYELRRDMNILLNEVAKYGRRVSDLVELWDKEGMPGVRA